MSGEPKITKTHRWPPEMVARVEAIAEQAGVPRQAVWDRCVEIGLRARPFLTPIHNRHPVWTVVVEFPKRLYPHQTTQIHGPFEESAAWETAERLARQYGVPVQARDIHSEVCVWVCAMLPASFEDEEAGIMERRINWTERPDGAYEAWVDGHLLQVYWDDQDPNDEGWAWRWRSPDGHEESGPANSLEEAMAEAESCARMEGGKQ